MRKESLEVTFQIIQVASITDNEKLEYSQIKHMETFFFHKNSECW